MTDKERAHANNGIWLCRNCHAWADKRDGRHCSAEQLLAMKSTAVVDASSNLGAHSAGVVVSGRHFAAGIGEVLGLEIGPNAKNVSIQPGTVASALGCGRIIATKIGG